MPELPEVEVTRLGLKPLLKLNVGKVIIRNYSLRWPINSLLPELLKNQMLLDLNRRGKYILAKGLFFSTFFRTLFDQARTVFLSFICSDDK